MLPLRFRLTCIAQRFTIRNMKNQSEGVVAFRAQEAELRIFKLLKQKMGLNKTSIIRLALRQFYEKNK
jgi:hypothetical protein